MEDNPRPAIPRTTLERLPGYLNFLRMKTGPDYERISSTVIAQEKLHAAGKKAKNFRPVIDQVAAVEILNTWLDSTLG